MADFSPDFTPRYKVQYRAAGVLHFWGCRFARGTTTTDILVGARVVVHDMFNAWAATRLADDFEFLAEYYCPQDSNVFLPSGFLPTAVTGTFPVASFSPTQKVTQWSVPGRSQLSKGRSVIFGLNTEMDDVTEDESKGYVTASEEAALSTAIAALNSGDLVGNDGSTLTFYARATIKPNDYLLRQVRKGVIS